MRNIYDKLDIPYDLSEIEEYLKNNSVIPTSAVTMVTDSEKIADNKDIKAKLKGYVDNNINLNDFSIEVNPANDEDGNILKYIITIENEKTEQYSRFILPYSLNSNYTKKKFEDNLYKKIAYSLKKKVEENEYLKLKNSRYAELKVGDTFEFGKFKGNPIKWIVLKNRNGKLLVLSDKILCKKAYGGKKWDKSNIRIWLNNEFYNSSFSESEKNFIDLSERTNYDDIISFSIAENTKDGTTVFNSDMTIITLIPKNVIDIDGVLCKVPYGREKNFIKTKDKYILIVRF